MRTESLPRQPERCLIGAPGSRARLATPALVLDLDALEHNLAVFARECQASTFVLRPHCKTHKCTRIARLQIEAGAAGICASTLAEVSALVEAQIPGVLLTTPVFSTARADALARLVDRASGLTAVVDGFEGIAILEESMRRHGTSLPVLVDLDLGSMLRTGAPDIDSALALARRLESSDVLRYAGVQFYSGIVQHIAAWEERKRFYAGQLEKLAAVVEALVRSGLRPQIVTGGGTGTFALDRASGLLTENQAGSYLFMDVEYEDIQIFETAAHPLRTALFVQGSVVSCNVPGMATTDAGTKSLATDGPRPRIASGCPPGAVYEYFGDEFGMILFEDAARRIEANRASALQISPPIHRHELFYRMFADPQGETGAMAPGAKFELVTPHCDPTVNLHDVYHCVRGDTLVDIWPVDMRGHP